MICVEFFLVSIVLKVTPIGVGSGVGLLVPMAPPDFMKLQQTRWVAY